MTDSAPIRAIAVHRSDVATALEATMRTDRRVVLRITPPLTGRKRARIHEVHATAVSRSKSEVEAPIHVDPRHLVADVPSYPEVDDTAAAYPDVELETRRKRHAEAVSAWRDTVASSVVDAVILQTDRGDYEVDVVALG